MEENCADKKVREETKSILAKYEKDKSNLIQVLNEIQEHFGYIPPKAQMEISRNRNG